MTDAEREEAADEIEQLREDRREMANTIEGQVTAIRELQAQIALLKAVVRELAPYPADKLPPHIKKALGD